MNSKQDDLEERVRALERRIKGKASFGLLFIVWAQLIAFIFLLNK